MFVKDRSSDAGIGSYAGIIDDAEAIVRNNPPCNCGKPVCPVCVAKDVLGIGSETKQFQNQNLEGDFQMSTNQQNQEIAAKFKNGQSYLAEWSRDKNLRDEFDGSFESWCFYKSAYDDGRVRMCGRRGGA